MSENSKGQMPREGNNSDESTSKDQLKETVTNPGTSDQHAIPLNEKSSTMGRGNARSGLSSKDGLTGSDLDGQVTH